MPKKAGGKKQSYRKKRKIILLSLALVIISSMAGLVYGLSYSESSDAFKQLTVIVRVKLE